MLDLVVHFWPLEHKQDPPLGCQYIGRHAPLAFGSPMAHDSPPHHISSTVVPHYTLMYLLHAFCVVSSCVVAQDWALGGSSDEDDSAGDSGRTAVAGAKNEAAACNLVGTSPGVAAQRGGTPEGCRCTCTL